MKKIILYGLCLLMVWELNGCKKDSFPGADVAPFIAAFDIRDIYKGQDVKLSKSNMFGSELLTGIVVSDHSGGNLPAGLLAVQDKHRLNKLRGIALDIGAEADKYVTGDSVIINLNGGVLTKVDGLLEIKGIAGSAITKVSSGNVIEVKKLTTAQLLADPDAYESTMGTIVKGGFDPLPVKGDILSGTKLLNDGFGNMNLVTDPKAKFADSSAPVLANFTGIVLNKQINPDSLAPQFYLRTSADMRVLSSEINIPPVIITGFMSDVKGGDGNYEYAQLLATKDIDFAQTPFAFVVTNNANASTPTGPPNKGWATGDMRTFKFNMFNGKVSKGQFFYVGGAGQKINGSGSTSMSSSFWARSFNYTSQGGDGFGKETGGLFANSGNAFGMAVFADSAVTANSVPVDVIFISTGGSLFAEGSATKGYKIANTDFYDIIDPISLNEQHFYQQGTNTLCFSYNTKDVGYFNMLGGIYDLKLGRWTKARAQVNVELTKASLLPEIEGLGATTLVE
ncbi:MAG TPA: DUF5689 domain-containing protein [Arachidicoccus sp.]|nr:DUF5689 domain-containing protein [Arachidicoccus sp.]